MYKVFTLTTGSERQAGGEEFTGQLGDVVLVVPQWW